MTGVPEPAYEAAPTSTTPAGGVDHRQRAAESPLRAPAFSPRQHDRTDRYAAAAERARVTRDPIGWAALQALEAMDP